jgi:dipeptidyl aminopeptidase/acylaminoacyl peptidase
MPHPKLRASRTSWSLAFVCLLAACAQQQSAAPPPESAAAATASPPAAQAQQTQAPVEEPGVVRFFDRRVDLKPFLSGFPYRAFQSQLEDRKLYYLDTRERYTLLELTLDEDTQTVDLKDGKPVTNADFSQRSLWSVHYLPQRSELWLHADERNDERMNLYRVDKTSPDRKMVQETHEDYLYDYGFSEDGKWLAYLPRRGTKAPYDTCLRVRKLGNAAGEAPEEREVVCDSPSLRFTWGRITFSKDDREVYFTAQLDDDRKRVQLVRVDLNAKPPKVEPITDVTRSRSAPNLLEGWANGEKLVWFANDDGFDNLYVYTRKNRKVQQLTHYQEDIDTAQLMDDGVFVSHGTPARSVLELVDLKSGKALTSTTVPGQVLALDAHGKTVLWTHEAPDVVFELNATKLQNSQGAFTFHKRKLAGPDPALEAAIVQCQAEAVKIPTFDVDPKTGQQRLLHAFLLSPRHPLGPDDHAPGALAMIRSFYGGDNVYTDLDHILCAAGMTVLSPSVRGSTGFGKEFFALNDKDLGGDEIVDLFYAARWLEKRTGLPPARIGVYGRSHGGYATMRALTFPPETNGRNASYPFGFGMAEAGFSDIEAFFHATNIPDWVVLEAGDPADPKELAKIRDRSPIHHVDRLNAPLFLLHGENDWRVPVEGSRAFASAAKAAHKPVTYVEIAGQGHHVEGLERIAQAFQARFDFLMSLFGSAR